MIDRLFNQTNVSQDPTSISSFRKQHIKELLFDILENSNKPQDVPILGKKEIPNFLQMVMK